MATISSGVEFTPFRNLAQTEIFCNPTNYRDAGYDAVMLTDSAFYRSPNLHTARDTPDTLNYTRMAMVVRGVYGAVCVL